MQCNNSPINNRETRVLGVPICLVYFHLNLKKTFTVTLLTVKQNKRVDETSVHEIIFTVRSQIVRSGESG